MAETMNLAQWTLKVTAKLAKFSVTVESLASWRFPWSEWWASGQDPEDAAMRALNLANNYPPSHPVIDEVRQCPRKCH